MAWVPLDAILVVLFATFFAGLYALLAARGYRRLLLGWLASLAGAILGYFLGQLLQFHVLWLGSFPLPEVAICSLALLFLALRFRV